MPDKVKQPCKKKVKKSPKKAAQKLVDNSAGDFYLVAKVLQRKPKKKVRGQTLGPKDYIYKVRWQGYSSNSDTWEPLENVNETEEYTRFMLDNGRVKKEEEKEKEKIKESPEKQPKQPLFEDDEDVDGFVICGGSRAS